MSIAVVASAQLAMIETFTLAKLFMDLKFVLVNIAEQYVFSQKIVHREKTFFDFILL